MNETDPAVHSGDQDSDSTITVVARRQSEALSDVPASISVLTAEALADSGIATTEQAIAFIPGVTIVSNAAQVGDAQINIRGVNGARDAENNVALVVDGILKTNTAAVNQYMGAMQQFEVLKGPQGAYYGRGATAGAIVLTTKKPSDVLEFSGRAYWATQDSQLLEGSVSGPVSDTIGAVVFGRYRHTDGFYKNTGPDPRTQGNTIDQLEEWSVGTRLVFEPTDDLSIDAKVRYGEVTAAALKFNAVFALPSFAQVFANPDFYLDVNDHDFTFQRNIPSIDKQTTKEASLKFDYDLGGMRLSAWGSFNQIDETFAADATAAALGRFNGRESCINSVAELFADGVTLPSPLFLAPTPGASILGAFGPTTCDGYQVTVRDQKDYSAEIRLASDDASALQWSLGAYYLHINRRYGTAINEDTGGDILRELYVPADGQNPTTQLFDDKLLTDVYAGFGSLEYTVSDRLILSGALRYDREERSVKPLVPDVTDPITGGSINPGYDVGTLSSQSATYQQLQPKANVRFEVTPDFSIYADYGVGFKAGGFNSQGSAALIDIYFNDLMGSNIGVGDDYDKEVSHAIELGFKAELLGGDLTLSGAAYRNMVKDMQFFEYYTGTFGLLRTISNIDKVRLMGAEFGLNWRVADWLTLDAGGNVLDSKILKNSVRPDTVGNKSPYSADYTLNLGMLIEQPLNDALELTFKADYRLTGPTWFHTVQDQERRTIFDVFFPGLGIGEYSRTRRDAYSIVNLRGGLKADNWRIAAFANNVFKKRYLEEIIPAPEFGGSFVTPGSLRTIGVEVGFDF
ncbi:TonB-dependent receptor domain-containing protein [Croceicoccus sp. BE223]|uniref:TonB-dependent receptor n=1 Tax=Croceicoccus sp. BE223 TaxID=2817716 RepID=UPI0028576E6F|nr:TonB-dependent receptor [Croceicoccus sp. BE223]MDR7103090.1 iron complex outermembrane receptor protein [Croceicoccus sp. BE223]